MESKIKISEDIIKIRPDKLEPHPWNFERSPVTTEEKEEWINFKESIWRDGIWADKPILISKEKSSSTGKHFILRGRRRWKAISEGIKKEKLPANYSIPAVYLLSDESTLYEAIYGDNDTPFKYRPEDRYRIIKERWGVDAILEINSGGSRKGEIQVRTPLYELIHSAIPSWSKATIIKDLTNLRKILKEESETKYPELSEERITNLNRQIRSWWERKSKILKLEEELEEVKQGYKEKIQKISEELSTYSKGFPIAGGPERYISSFINSKRPEFKSLQEIRGLKEFIKKNKSG
ncbi:hypothetical protein [Leptospira bouyouniensis]|uniref:hypothetical protein n=1 Tax=Leptospira bouyouniensis TaxID=2484911 RepID=UPI001090DDA0|nr:hypothetical protein [Leptospira bouyouniensis]TGM88284.1 hypothetical protein EHQ99_00265 [Leptospira bouyouniensis]